MDRRRKFYVAMAVFAVLALLAWFTLSDGIVALFPIPRFDGSRLPYGAVPLRLRTMTLTILGLLALRTWLHWHAENIREEREREEAGA